MSEATYRQMTFTPRELAEARYLSDNFAGYWARSETIAENLDIDLADLQGLVLNVGAGVGMSLEHDVSQVTGQPARVISYDLSYRSDLPDYNSAREALQESLDERAGEAATTPAVGLVAVAGYAEALPFRNGVFDLTIAHASVPTHARYYEAGPTTRHLVSALAEMVRVTAPSGKVITAPIAANRVEEVNQFMNCQSLSPEVQDWTITEFRPSVNKSGGQAYRLTIQK